MNQVIRSNFRDDTAAATELSPYVLGSIVLLCLSSPVYRNVTLSNLESSFLPPINLEQYRLFSAPSQPVGVAFWAFVTDAVAENLMRGDTVLAPHQWRCGRELWLVDLIAPYGDKDAMIDDLKVSLFPQTPINFIEFVGGRSVTRRA